MSFDVGASLRRLKPDRRTVALERRPDAQLGFAHDAPDEGPSLLFDTTVYIDNLAARLPSDVERLIRARRTRHSSIALAELTHGLGRLDPADPRTKDTVARIGRVIDAIPERLLSAPSIRAFGEAGIVAGMVARLRGTAPTHAQALLNDALLFLHATEQGALLLSRNTADLDLIQQLVPSGRVLFYRKTL